LQEQSWQEHCRRLGYVLDSVAAKPQPKIDFRELESEKMPQQK
jgi:hypothetical protein